MRVPLDVAGEQVTFEDFFVSTSSHGNAVLNCPYGRTKDGEACDWWYWWEMFPSIRTMRREAMNHLCHAHLVAPPSNEMVNVVTLIGAGVSEE